jgi:protein-tyrosine phosphatase
MKYSIIFIASGIGAIALSLQTDIARLFFCWCGVSFLIVGIAYGWLGAKVFGKQSDGSMAWWAIALLWPYLLLTWSIWHVQRIAIKEKCCHEIGPGIWLGRRPFLQELPANINLIVDLTAEFPARPKVIAGKTYICLPTLDGMVPGDRPFRELIEQLVLWQGNMYIHCALGHGRSATVAAALLVAKKLAENGAQAEAAIASKRPQIGLTKVQRHLLKRVTNNFDISYNHDSI